jgi:hypothetical protein
MDEHSEDCRRFAPGPFPARHPLVDLPKSRFSPIAEDNCALGMKTTISIPDDVFEDAERLARRLQTSRSRPYARALAEFVARHDDDHVSPTMNQVVEEVGGAADAFAREAARRSLQRVEW